MGFHRHVLDYFWSVLTSGRARAHMDDGSTVEHTYTAGETRHETHAGGHFKVHDLENIGDSELIFCTVEFLDSANKPLPVPDKVRLKGAIALLRRSARPSASRPLAQAYGAITRLRPTASEPPSPRHPGWTFRSTCCSTPWWPGCCWAASTPP